MEMEKLNEELIWMILDRLSDPVAVKSLTQTSKWFYAVESRHRSSAKILRADLLLTVLRRYRNLTHLDLSLCRNVDSFQLQSLFSYATLTTLKLTTLPACPTHLLQLDLSNATSLTDSAASAIARATNLERLSLVRCKLVTDMGIGCIAVGCRKLKSLNLKWCLRISDLGVGLLAVKCTLLRQLDLSFVPITEKCLLPILQLPNMEELVLVGCLGLDDDDLALLNHTSSALKTLDLSNCQNITHIGLASLIRGAQSLNSIALAYASAVTLDVAKCLQHFSMLQHLRLDGCLLTSSAFQMIATWSGSLAELSLSKCSGITDEGMSHIVRRHTQLRKLDITCCRKITSASILSIATSCTALTSLKMEACSLVPSKAFEFIGQRCPLLQELDVTDNALDNEGLKSISRCLRLSTLKLGICLNITDEGLIQIGMHCSQLKEIDLYRAIRITDIGVASIAQGCSALELINVAYCDQITDASLISLSQCSRLKALEARGCPRFTSEGLAAIAAGCRQLSFLDIKKCFKINNAGMIPLAHYSQNLKQVNLSYCSVTDLGLLALASISRLQNMTILHLGGLSPNGLGTALLACRGLKKVKLHTSFKALLPHSLIALMESRGCVFHWRDKAFQPQVDTDPLEWNQQTGRSC